VHARTRRETPRQTLDTPLQPSPAIRSQPSSYFVPDMKISSMSPLSSVVRALSCCWRSAAALLEKAQSFCRRVCVCVCVCVSFSFSLSQALSLCAAAACVRTLSAGSAQGKLKAEVRMGAPKGQLGPPRICAEQH
jgi:hypothetical protein